MKMTGLKIMMVLCVFFMDSCNEDEYTYQNGDIEIVIETGEQWLHNYPLFLGICKKNAPQFAVWIEDTEGNYISTLFVTEKIATEGWQANNGNRRKESLPHWCYTRGETYWDGLFLPTKEQALSDAISGATPKTNKTLIVHANNYQLPLVIKAEFNHSIDFNDDFPEDASPGDSNYSGGKDGSGQPAVIYATTVDKFTDTCTMTLIGCSSPDGNDGDIYDNTDELTTATKIVKCIRVNIK
jgi:hypothetical protein